ncbi:MliC family protein [Nitrosomonas sp. Nm58]|uniref:MliC family protein n=1 Tax=Nitrosomonas sp. Nm58 TaxID=200126 RepID=UPI003528A1CC
MTTFFQTDPPTLIAERGDQVSLMYLQPSASGSKYQGRNESLWEHKGGAHHFRSICTKQIEKTSQSEYYFCSE